MNLQDAYNDAAITVVIGGLVGLACYWVLAKTLWTTKKSTSQMCIRWGSAVSSFSISISASKLITGLLHASESTNMANAIRDAWLTFLIFGVLSGIILFVCTYLVCWVFYKVWGKLTSSSDVELNELYAKAMSEVEEGRIDKGLWAKCFVQTGGDEAKAKAAYITHRVKGLRPLRPRVLDPDINP